MSRLISIIRLGSLEPASQLMIYANFTYRLTSIRHTTTHVRSSYSSSSLRPSNRWPTDIKKKSLNVLLRKLTRCFVVVVVGRRVWIQLENPRGRQGRCPNLRDQLRPGVSSRHRHPAVGHSCDSPTDELHPAASQTGPIDHHYEHSWEPGKRSLNYKHLLNNEFRSFECEFYNWLFSMYTFKGCLSQFIDDFGWKLYRRSWFNYEMKNYTFVMNSINTCLSNSQFGETESNTLIEWEISLNGSSCEKIGFAFEEDSSLVTRKNIYHRDVLNMPKYGVIFTWYYSKVSNYWYPLAYIEEASLIDHLYILSLFYLLRYFYILYKDNFSLKWCYITHSLVTYPV